MWDCPHIDKGEAIYLPINFLKKRKKKEHIPPPPLSLKG
jgi:hypothetical protein